MTGWNANKRLERPAYVLTATALARDRDGAAPVSVTEFGAGREQAAQRKLWLFGCDSCRLVWDALTPGWYYFFSGISSRHTSRSLPRT